MHTGAPSEFTVQPIPEQERAWLVKFLLQRWGDYMMVTRGKLWDLSQLPGFAAWQDGEVAGVATYRIEAGECEITSLDSVREGRGIGSALIQAVRQQAQQAGCTRLWLITTNDNTHALRFYQKRGFRIAAAHIRAVDRVSRLLKPSIPLLGEEGIPIRDEIELEILLEGNAQDP
jgi:ribosomal protein S18 acetylase RimI-like enzyme